MTNSASANSGISCSQEIFDRVIHDFAPQISTSYGIVTRDALPKVQIDSAPLEILFRNLLAHSLTSCQEHAPRIHLCAKVSDNIALFSLADNGVGIAPEAHEKIFELHQPGINLANCKKIIESTQGKIWVKSTPGEGATFYFTLPVA